MVYDILVNAIEIQTVKCATFSIGQIPISKLKFYLTQNCEDNYVSISDI